MKGTIPSDAEKRKIRAARRRKHLAFKATNTAVLLAVVWAASRLLRVSESFSSPLLTWCAAAVYYSAALAFAVWLFSVVGHWLRKSVVAMFCFAALFVWGSASYFTWHADEEEPGVPGISAAANAGGGEGVEFRRRLLEVPNRAVSAFFPSRGGFERIDRRYCVHYFLFHLAVFAFVAAVTFSHFGRGLVNRVKRHVVPEGLLDVFWGLDEPGLLLAADVAGTTVDREAAFLLPEELRFDAERFKAAVSRLDRIDAMWILADLSDPPASVLKGHRHFFLSPSGHVNVGLADRMVAAMARSGRKKPDDVFLYVRIEAEEEESVFFEWAERVKEWVTPIIVRESDMIAKRFVEDHPMLDCPGIAVDPDRASVSGSFRILLLGLGTTGRSVLREMVSNGQYLGTSGFSVDVIEGDPAVVEAFRARHAEAVAEYGIRIVEGVKAEGAGFETFLVENLRSYNRIVVCLSGDVMNIRVASKIARCVTPDGIGPVPGSLFVRVSDPVRRSYFGKGSGMTLFGDLRDVYSLATLDYDPVDRMARILNGEWAKDKSDAGLEKAWLRASFGDRRSSRASALGERNLARVAGFEIAPASDGRPEVSKAEFDAVLAGDSGRRAHGAPVPRATVLAEDEHLRWNAYHRMLGYSRWDMQNPPLSAVAKKKANQLAAFGKHACLVPFADLPAVDYAIACALRKENRRRLSPADFEGEVRVDAKGDGKPAWSLQAYDYLFVRKIQENARAAGMKLVRARAPGAAGAEDKA